MPTFPPFNFFGTFPQIASNESVPWLVGVGGSQSNSTINNLKQSIPMWWLLYKLTINVDISLANSGTMRSGSANFDIVFTSPESPKNRICRENNLIDGGGVVENFSSSGDWVNSPPPSNGTLFSLNPFLCDSLHVCFYTALENVSSIPAEAYVTSSENSFGANDSGLPSDVENLKFKEITIDSPYSDPINLYGAINMFQPSSTTTQNTGSGDISVKSVEWWEVE